MGWIAALARALPTLLWGAASIGLFAGIWELLWAIGWADAKLLPPPHIFLGGIADQALHRWSEGRTLALERVDRLKDELATAGPIDLAMLSVAASELRSLV